MRILQIILLLIVVSNVGFGQHSSFHHLNDRQHLSQLTVLSIYQDEFDQMWLATRNGLNKYDGTRMESIKHIVNDTTTISDNNILNVTGDRNGNVYFINNTALSCYNLASEKIIVIEKSGIEAIAHGSMGLLVVKKGEILLLNKKSNTLESLFKIDKSIDAFNILELSNGDICIGSRYGLHIADRSRKITHILPESRINSVFEDKSKNLWVCTEQNGLFLVNNKKISLNFKSEDGNSNSLLSNNVRCIREDNDGNYWIGTSKGLSQYNIDKRQFTQYQYAQSNPYGLSSNSITSMYKDHQGSIWIGSYFGGVNIHNSQYSNTQIYRKQDSPKHLSGQVISKIIEQNKDVVWVCTEDGGLNKFEPNNGTFTSYLHNPSMPRNIKTALLDSNQDILWLGSHNDGFHRFDINTNRISRIKIGNTAGENNYVRAIVERNNKLYLGTHSSVLVYDKQNGESTPLFSFVNHPEFLNMQIWDMIIDSYDNLWFSTQQKLYRYSFAEEKLYTYTNNPKDKNSISNCYQNTFFETHAGEVYIGSAGGGLNIYDHKNDNFKHVNSTNSALIDDYILGISQTDLGYILLATNKGLVRYDEQNQQFINYPNRGFFYTPAINERGIHTGRYGNVYISSIDGLVVFDDSKLNLAPTKFKINVSEIYLNNKLITPHDDSEILEESILYLPDIKLESKYSTFAIKYTVTNYLKSITPKIEYKLEGFNNEWIESKGNTITYTNLSAGNYKLRIRVEGTDSYIEPQQVLLNIKALPPIHKSTLAYIIYILLLILIVYIIVHYAKVQLKLKSSLILANLEKNQTDEINQIKLRFFTNISHEFRLPLTLIKAQFESLIESSETPRSVYLKILNILKNVEKMDYLFNELLDFRKQSQNTGNLNLIEVDVTELLDQVVLTFKEYARIKKIELEFDPSNNFILVADSKQLEKVFYNIISNAFKFSHPHHSINVSIQEEMQNVIITIADTGIGVNKEDLDNIFERFYQCDNNDAISNPGTGIGLSLCKNIVEAHNGRIWAEQNTPSGMIIKVELPLTNEQHALPHEVSEKIRVSDVIYDTSTNLEKESLLANTEEKKDRTILIVEDSSDLQNILSEAFNPLYNVYIASDGEEGYQKAIEIQPDIILSDVMMPKMSGVEMCQRLKTHIETSHIPVVLLTARVGSEATLEGYLNGADDYIAKPFSSKILIARCNNIVNMRRTLQQKFANNKTISNDVLPTTPKDVEFMEKAISIIEKNLSNPQFGVVEFADMMHLGRTTLFKKIKGVVGLTPNEFIRNIRLKKAAQLLSDDKDYSVAEVAVIVGFNDSPYFIRSFKKTYGITPAKFKNNNTKQQ